MWTRIVGLSGGNITVKTAVTEQNGKRGMRITWVCMKSQYRGRIACWYSSSGSNFWGGARNMKYQLPRSVSIFLWLLFTNQGAWPLAPFPRILDCILSFKYCIAYIYVTTFDSVPCKIGAGLTQCTFYRLKQRETQQNSLIRLLQPFTSHIYSQRYHSSLWNMSQTSQTSQISQISHNSQFSQFSRKKAGFRPETPVWDVQLHSQPVSYTEKPGWTQTTTIEWQRLEI